MSNHEQLAKEAEELYDALDEGARDRMAFGWSYVGNHELGDLIRRIGRVEAVIYGTIIAGILGAIILKAI